jgi:hypothetical protein
VRLPSIAILAFFPLAALSCSKGEAKENPRRTGLPEHVPSEPSTPPAVEPTPAPAPTKNPTQAPPPFVEWLKKRLPPGGEVEAGNPPVVKHRVSAGDTAQSIADAYLDLTETYLASDLAALIAKKSLAPGSVIEIPTLRKEPYKEPNESRLGWPEDKVMRGLFMTGVMAGKWWVPTLDKMVERGMNVVVLDGKDYMGQVNYPSKVKVAIEADATKMHHHFIPNIKRTIRFAHERGIRVVLRLPCFHDPWTAKRVPRLSVQGYWGKPYPLGWLDPNNPEAQEYALQLAEEMADLGADEIQLDYVRFPVQGTKGAVLPPAAGSERSKIIRDFVKRVADVVHAKGVKLSLDVFGVASTGQQSDIDALGQDLSIMPEYADAISPMVYPSHYEPGFMGFKDPANRPEIVGIGTKAAVAKLKKGKNDRTVVRSWLQAFAWRTPAYGPKYVAEQIKHASANGTGWLLWDPGCTYGGAWGGIPKIK